LFVPGGSERAEWYRESHEPWERLSVFRRGRGGVKRDGVEFRFRGRASQ